MEITNILVLKFCAVAILIFSLDRSLAQTVDLSELDCHELELMITNILDEDRSSDKDTRAQAPLIYRQLLLKECGGTPAAMNLMGLIYYNENELVQAKQILLAADSLLSVDSLKSKTYVRNQLYLGLVDLNEGRQISAEMHFDKSLRISEDIGYKKGLLQGHLNMGISQVERGDSTSASKFLTKAWQISNEIESKLLGGYATLNLARLCIEGKNYQQALEYSRQTNKIWSTLEYHIGLYYNYLNIANIHRDLGQTKSRIENLKKAVEHAEHGGGISRHLTYQELGEYYQSVGNRSEAIIYFEKALDQGESINQEALEKLTTHMLDLYAANIDISGIKRFNRKLAEIYQAKAELSKLEAKKWKDRERTLERQIDENKQLRTSQIEADLKLRKRNLILLFLAGLSVAIIAVAVIKYRESKKRHILIKKIKTRNDKLTVINNELSLQKAKVEEKSQQILAVQDQLIVQAKLASLGQLTAGIAHEIKNPINFVNNFAEGSSELLDELLSEMIKYKEKLPESDYLKIITLIQEINQNATDIHRSGSRADRIVRSMMDHARGTKGERELVSLHTLIDDNTNLAYHGFRAFDPSFTVSFQKKFSEEVEQIRAFPLELGRVFLNIFNNACDAISQKMRQSKNGYQPIIAITTENRSKHVIIRIRDNGLGMTSEVQEGIFQPFFTTKSLGKGNTGLGLSISYDIITNLHMGTIEVESTPGQYSEFIINLPKLI